MRKTSLRQALSTQACFSRRCQCRLALDPRHQGAQRKFPTFKGLSLCSCTHVSDLCNQLTSNVKKLYTASVFKSACEPILQDCRQPNLTSLPCLIPLGTTFRVNLEPFVSFFQVSLVLSVSSNLKRLPFGTNWRAEHLFHNSNVNDC